MRAPTPAAPAAIAPVLASDLSLPPNPDVAVPASCMPLLRPDVSARKSTTICGLPATPPLRPSGVALRLLGLLLSEAPESRVFGVRHLVNLARGHPPVTAEHG